MKVLITGSGGQLGRALVNSAPAKYAVEATGLAELDLCNEEAICSRILKRCPDLVINAAAYTAVDRAEVDENSARAINAVAVASMASALAQTGGKLGHVSTDFVCDGTSSRPYRPDDKPSPISAYGRTKAEGEAAAGHSALIVRTAWVHAAGGRNFVRTMLGLMAAKNELRVVADQIGSPTWAPGLARVLWGLIDKGAHGIFHHSDAGVASWYDFAVAIQEEALAIGLLSRAIAIHPVATSEYPTPARRPAFSLLDCSATRALLGDGHTHWRTNLRFMLEEELKLG